MRPSSYETTLNANACNSYRYISSLSFISNVLEKVISSRLNINLNCNHLYNVFQSVYKQVHSSETVLLEVRNDISLNIDTGKVRAFRCICSYRHIRVLCSSRLPLCLVLYIIPTLTWNSFICSWYPCINKRIYFSYRTRWLS